MKMKFVATPVSYTHLDVYKRQYINTSHFLQHTAGAGKKGLSNTTMNLNTTAQTRRARGRRGALNQEVDPNQTDVKVCICITNTVVCIRTELLKSTHIVKYKLTVIQNKG